MPAERNAIIRRPRRPLDGSTLVSARHVLLAAAGSLLMSGQALAQNRTADAIQGLLGAVEGAVAQTKLQREIAAMSAPLTYETAVPPLDPTDPTDPRNFDIAGVRLGMSPAAAEQAFRSNGYRKVYLGEQRSFDTRVRQGSAECGDVRQIMVPQRITAEGPARQQVQVKFLALPEGAKVSEVHFSMHSSDDMAEAAFAAQVHAKYGEPRETNDDDRLMWCPGSGGDCGQDWRDLPLLSITISERSMELTDDPAQEAGLDARAMAEVEKRRPRVKDAGF